MNLDPKLKTKLDKLCYWRDISECDCSNSLPQGGCLRCDLEGILELVDEKNLPAGGGTEGQAGISPPSTPGGPTSFRGVEHSGVWCCSEKSKCQWQGFALYQGLAWGTTEGPTSEWREMHDQNCRGELVQLVPPNIPSPRVKLKIGEKIGDKLPLHKYSGQGLKLPELTERFYRAWDWEDEEEMDQLSMAIEEIFLGENPRHTPST